jgi:hypothetical protein
MAAPRTEVKVYLSPEERDRLDREASQLNSTRGQLIRERALGVAAPGPISTDTYAAAVFNAARTVSGVPRPHLEAIVASVINTITKAHAAD